MDNVSSIAVTGMSGRFPKCNNVQELQEALYSGKDLISDTHSRWSYETLETSARMGMVTDFPYFDASFFGISTKDANNHDHRTRKLLEVSYEAIADAGLNLSELRGTDVGMFLAMSQNDILDIDQRGGILYHSPGFIVNFISYAYDFKGPSIAINTLCSSGIYTLVKAIDSMIAGHCSTAVVMGVQHQFDPTESLEFLKNRVLHIEGVSRIWDATRKGYVKGEAVVAVVLQKVEKSKRIYATIAGMDINSEGFTQGGIGRPSHERQIVMHENVHRNYGLSNLDISYMECHSTGTVVGDSEEILALDAFYTKGRKTPLLIGAIKSNLGHTEIASGLVSLIKVLISIREGVIPANRNYFNPDPNLKGIYEGRLKVVDKNTPLPEGLIGIDCFGFGGANSIVIVKPNTQRKEIPNNLNYRLIRLSGSTQEAVQYLLENTIKHKKNKQFLSLIDSIHRKPLETHNYRGYAILSNNSHYEITQCSTINRPVWFVYAGFGSQWPGMAKDLMKIDVFRNTVEKCANAIKPYGIDLIDIIVNGNEEIFNNVAKTFPAITAISVALTDLLAAFGIEPNGIIGHSLGEVGCAYADGLLTPEEATLLAYARGIAATTAKLIPGAMAAIGLSIADCSKILPDGIYIACDNSDESVTISGPRESVKQFLDQLTTKGIFNRVISNANYAFHCPHLKPAGPIMLDFARKALKRKNLRTQRWLSTAFPESQWETDEAKWHSTDYHYHNYMNQVNFNQVLKHVPQDAVVIEVAPRGLLQSILKKALSSEVTLVSLAKPGLDNYDYLLSSIGKIYNSGIELDLEKYYKPDVFPVSVDTPTISSLIKWDHSVQWHTLKYNPEGFFGAKVVIDIGDEEYDYLEGHTVDGRVILPAAGYIVLVWQTLAQMLATPFRKLKVVFENVKTLRPVLLVRNAPTTLVVNIFKSGLFTIYLNNDDQLLSSGQVTPKDNVDDDFSFYPNVAENIKPAITKDEFYNSMTLRGFNYSGIFTGIEKLDVDGKYGKLRWNNNWVAFLDTMTQFILSQETYGHSLPTIYDKIVIDPEKHLNCVDSSSVLTLTYDKTMQSAKCGQIEIKNITVTNVKRRANEILPTVRKYIFVPNDDQHEEIDNFLYSLNVASQIVIENTTENLQLKIAELKSNNAIGFLRTIIDRVNLKKTTFYELNSLEENTDVQYDLMITVENIDSLKKNINTYAKRARYVFGMSDNSGLENFELIYRNVTKSGTYVLVRQSQPIPSSYKVIVANNNSYDWVLSLKEAVEQYKDSNSRIYLTNSDSNSGIVGLFNTIRLEQYCPNVRVFLINDVDNTERFSPSSKFYLQQIRKDMTVNIYQNKSWGTLRRLPLEENEPKLLSDAVLLKDKDGIRWVEKFSENNDKIVTVHFSSISSKDVLKISEKSGWYNEEEFLGLEYSGVTRNGITVMGILPKGSLATSVMPHPQLTWKFENKYTLEEAATIPLMYTLSYYGLFIQGDLTPNKSVLIHNWPSKVSMAAIALAVSVGCTVHVVAMEGQKLQDKNIISHSKDNPFYKTILDKTRGKGVNIVFNCNSDNLLKLSLNCLAKGGRMIEVGNKNVDNALIEEMLRKNCFFYNVNIDDIFEESENILDNISVNIANYVDKGIAGPFDFTIFGTNEIENAVNYYGEVNDTKKILIKVRNSLLHGYPRVCFNPKKSYVIVGGLGGLGFELAKWLIERGATKIVLNSRSKVRSGYHLSSLQKWKKEGLTVVTDTCDTSIIEGAETLLNIASDIAPIGGIFNTALYVEDAMMFELTPENFAAVAKSKIFCAQNLDKASRKICKDLDSFVMFSSVASSIGSPTQANYAFVNSAMERLCETRRAQGLPALTIEWGPLADVGILVRLKTKVQYLELQRQTLASCLKVIDRGMQQTDPVITSCVQGNDSDEANQKKTIVESVAELLNIKDVEKIDDTKSLLDLGMDSLVAYELQHVFLKECGVELSVNDIKVMNFEAIKKLM